MTKLILNRLNKIDDKLDRIEIQTTRTNGKVIVLETSSVSNTKTLETFGTRLNYVEKKLSVDDALNNSGRYYLTIFLKLGPWAVVIIMFFLQLGIKNGLI